VTERGGAESVLAVGHADLAGTPLLPGHAFQIGSISKSFAVICALQLEAEGALSLDDPVTTYLPWFRVGGSRGAITLRHLMMHRSGLPMGSDPGPSSLALVAELAGAENGVGARRAVLVLEHRLRHARVRARGVRRAPISRARAQAGLRAAGHGRVGRP